MEITASLQQLQDDPDLLQDKFSAGLQLLESIIRGDVSFTSDEGAALKSGRLDEEITRRLHRPSV